MEENIKLVLAKMLARSDLNPEERNALSAVLHTDEKQRGTGAAESSNLVKAPVDWPSSIDHSAYKRRGPATERLRICLDFGTAMSKAWATGRNEAETLPLLIGKSAGGDGLIVASSIFIADNGRVYIGQEAEKQHRADLRPGRLRFDNLKRLLSEHVVGTELRSLPLTSGIDPTGSGLTGGDLLVLYLAWLTDISEIALVEALTATEGKLSIGRADPRGVPRRFAIPCFESKDFNDGRERSKWARDIMSDALLRAQLLADTLTGRWGQLTTSGLVPLMGQLHALDVRDLSHLISTDAAVREPIAAGASRFDAVMDRGNEPASAPTRELLLVIDAGAGTTDFALFQVITPIGQTRARYGLLRKSVRMSRIAGNEVDSILRPIILNACGVDPQKFSAEDVAYAQIDLDSRIRDIKRALFDTSTAEVDLRPHFGGTVSLNLLLRDSKMKSDGEELLEIRREIISSLFTQEELDAVRIAGGGGAIRVYVLLTGGSASIPIISNLGAGSQEIAGMRFRFTPVEELPDWIARLPRGAAEQMAAVYAQSAVAIGGSVANLPKELDDLETPITPPRPGRRRLERFQISGI
jgi:hypothetical protein